MATNMQINISLISLLGNIVQDINKGKWEDAFWRELTIHNLLEAIEVLQNEYSEE